MMRMKRGKWIRPLVMLLAALPAMAAAKAPEKIVLVADSRRFSDWRAWWANVYNESYLQFTLVTIVIVPLLGLVMGKLTGLILARIGINLKSRVLAER